MSDVVRRPSMSGGRFVKSMWNDKALYLEINHVPRCITLQGVEESDDLRVERHGMLFMEIRTSLTRKPHSYAMPFSVKPEMTQPMCQSSCPHPKGAPFDHAQTFAIVC